MSCMTFPIWFYKSLLYDASALGRKYHWADKEKDSFEGQVKRLYDQLALNSSDEKKFFP